MTRKYNLEVYQGKKECPYLRGSAIENSGKIVFLQTGEPDFIKKFEFPGNGLVDLLAKTGEFLELRNLRGKYNIELKINEFN